MIPNPRIAGYYAVGTLFMVLVTLQGWPWTAPLLWPALALALVVVAYMGLGPVIYGKTGGVVPVGSRLLCAPTLLGQYLSLEYYRRKCSTWNEVVPGLLIGRVLTEEEAVAVIRSGVTAVLDLTAEFSETPALRKLAYRNLRLLDLTAPTSTQLRGAVQFIGEHHSCGGCVYVHCKVGYSRTAVVVGAYLVASGNCNSLDEAVTLLRAARPGIVIRPESMKALRSFCEQSQSAYPVRLPDKGIDLPRAQSAGARAQENDI